MLKVLRFIFFIFSFFVEVEIQAEPFTKITVEKSLKAEIMQITSFADFDVVVDTWQTNWANQTNDKPFNIIELNLTPDQKRFNAAVSLGDAATGQVVRKISGKIQKFIMLPVLSGTVSKQTPITESNLTYVRFLDEKVNQGTVLRKEDIVGKTLKAGCSLHVDKPLQMSDLEVPVVIRKGEQIRISYIDPNFEVSIVGIAKSNGSIGERITFEVGSDKKKIVQATVMHSGRAEIRENL